MENSRSQRVARLLEILNYFLLLPASIIEIAVVSYGLVYLSVGNVFVFILSLIFTLVYAFGTLLLYGYFKHSRGHITKSSAILLWVGTIVFNLLPFSWMLWSWANKHFTMDQSSRIWLYNILGSYISVILLAVVALLDDLRRKFN